MRTASRSNLQVIDRHYSTVFNVHFMAARQPDGKFILGVEYPNEAEIDVVRRVSKEATIARHFQNAVQNEEDYINDRKLTDFLKQKIYRWENALIQERNIILDELTAKKLLGKIQRKYKLPATKLIWQENKEDQSHFDGDIHFNHDDLISFLHEAAHYIIEHKIENADETVEHPPVFVWQAIELYHEYAGFNLEYLVKTAAISGILGDMEANQVLFPLPDQQVGKEFIFK